MFARNYKAPLRKGLSIPALMALAVGMLAMTGAETLRAEEPDPFAVAIMAGRLSVLQDRASDIVRDGVLGPVMPLDPDDESERAETYRSLYLTVAEANNLQARLCGRSLIDPALCEAAYDPPWLVPPLGMAPTWPMLDGWIDEALEALNPLWGEICEAGRQARGDDLICSVE